MAKNAECDRVRRTTLARCHCGVTGTKPSMIPTLARTSLPTLFMKTGGTTPARECNGRDEPAHKLSVVTPATALLAPMSVVLVPARFHPMVAAARVLAVSSHPYVPVAIPIPIARDPNPAARHRRDHLGPRRRRSETDDYVGERRRRCQRGRRTGGESKREQCAFDVHRATPPLAVRCLQYGIGAIRTASVHRPSSCRTPFDEAKGGVSVCRRLRNADMTATARRSR
jgi:hypothetical protein